VATRFTVTQECGLPDKIKQEYFKSTEEEVVVNTISPTGYPMRMLTRSPAIGAGIRPNCEAYGYLLDSSGNCAYITAHNREVASNPSARKVSVKDKTCLCTHAQFRLLDVRPPSIASRTPHAGSPTAVTRS
jgi:nitronate monooxygenase